MAATRDVIAENLRGVKTRIEEACRRAGRDADSVTLLAVTKYARGEWVDHLIEAGVRDLGESRVSQLVDRARDTHNNVRWHMIGHLQRNKVRSVLPVATLIHSVDSVRLLEHIDRLAEAQNLFPSVLLEVNISREQSKHGFSPDELESEWATISSFPRSRLKGLMTMAPLDADPEQVRVVFRELRMLRDRLAQRSPLAGSLNELSMGMSGDFEIAIEEGATIVRLGSVLFENLPAGLPQ